MFFSNETNKTEVVDCYLHTAQDDSSTVQTYLVFCIPASISGVWYAQALEMSVGKIPFLEAVNGSTVVIPCTYASCIGIKNLYFNWQFNDNGTMQKVRLFCLKQRVVFGFLVVYLLYVVILIDLHLAGPLRCVSLWSHQRASSHMWVYIESG